MLVAVYCCQFPFIRRKKFHTLPTLALGVAERHLGCVDVGAGAQRENLRSNGEQQRSPLLNPLV